MLYGREEGLEERGYMVKIVDEVLRRIGYRSTPPIQKQEEASAPCAPKTLFETLLAASSPEFRATYEKATNWNDHACCIAADASPRTVQQLSPLRFDRSIYRDEALARCLGWRTPLARTEDVLLYFERGDLTELGNNKLYAIGNTCEIDGVLRVAAILPHRSFERRLLPALQKESHCLALVPMHQVGKEAHHILTILI